MPRDRYPDEVQLVNDDFSTDDRQKAVEELLGQWPVNMQDMEQEGRYSRSHYQQCRDEYLGPKGDTRTFGELKEQYGSIGEYLDQREQEDRYDIDPDALPSEDEISMFQEGFKKGHEAGFEAGYEKGRQSAEGQ